MSVVRAFSFLVILCFPASLLSQVFVDRKFSATTVVDLPDYTPVGIAFAPDGRLFVWQKAGTIRIVKNGALLETPFLTIDARVNRAADRGLIGFAFDPAFATNGHVYVAYVYEPGTANLEATPRTQRLSRFTVDPANPDRALPGSEKIILGTVSTIGCSGVDQDCIPNDMGSHTVDHIAFGKDGKLYLSVGDGASWKFVDQNSFRSQDLHVLNGKVLRINKDGSAPTDNPFYDGTNSNRSKIYSLGFRNPYRFTIKPGTNEPYVGDVGWKRYEEIDRGRGKNFGWPCWEGNSAQPEYAAKFPALCNAVPASAVTKPLFPYFEGGAITVGPFYTGTTYPAQYLNSLFFGDYNNDFVRRAIFDSAGTLLRVEDFATRLGGITHLIQGPDGNLYYTAFSEGKVMRIQYSANTLPVAKASATASYGYSPLTVQFNSGGSLDPDGDPFTVSWDFGDGSTSTEANPVHTYTADVVQTFQATLAVTDDKNGSAMATLPITVGSVPPTAEIVAPSSGQIFRPGDTVQFSGTASDADEGELSGASLHWDVLLHHRDHVHTETDATGTEGSFVVEEHDSVGGYYYELLLTARDSSGLEVRKSVKIDLELPPPVCAPPATVGVRICLPIAGDSATSPVRVFASATAPAGRSIVGLRAYVDNVSALYSNTALLDASTPMSRGDHYLAVKAWDSAGTTYLTSFMLRVDSSQGQVTIVPTTTLQALTKNTTSAPDSLALTSNGNARPGNISTLPIRSLLPGSFTGKVLAATMGWWGSTSHLNAGYRSDDPLQVSRQMADMKRRGIDGMHISWFGETDLLGQSATDEWMKAAEADGTFVVALRINKKVIEGRPAGQSETDALIAQLNYAGARYFQSPAYMRLNERPVVLEFGLEAFPIDWERVRAEVAGDALYVRRNVASLDGSRFSDGGYAWGASEPLSYFDYYNKSTLKYPSKLSFAAANKGFNDSIAAWSQHKIVGQECGMRWLNTFKNYNQWFATSSAPPAAIHLVTWNDYEEGTAIESGIDNCLTVSASVSASVLNWNLVGTGTEETIDHYDIYISQDGSNVMKLTEQTAGNHSLNLAGYDFADGSYTLFVHAAAKAGLLNKMSNAVSFVVGSSAACPALATSGVNLCAPTMGSSTTSPVKVTATASSAYPITGVTVYVDSTIAYSTKTSTKVDTTVPVNVGSHRITVKAWDSKGTSYKAYADIVVR